MNSVKETTINVSDVTHEIDKDTVNEYVSTDILRESTADAVQKDIQENNPMSDVLQRIEVPPPKNDEFLHSTNKNSDKRESSKKDGLPDKKFLARNSLLTDLFEIPHIRSIYNLFMVTLIILFFSTIASDIMEYGMVRAGTNTLQIGFAKFPTCIYIWVLMQTSTLGVYVAFTLWANQRLRFLPKSFIRKFCDYGWLSAFILYQVVFFIIPVTIIIKENLSIGCSLIIIAEQIRMVMKSWAFVRSAAPRYLSYEPNSETSRPSGPKFSQYLYFLFAPTLLYRDEYPRTDRIRWTVVFWNFAEVGLTIFYLAFILECLIAPIYHVFGTQYLDQKWFVKNIIEACIPGILNFVIGHYLLLHAWMNAWAEMLRFADRLFYKDWWNSTTYAQYYRTWNIVVHDWLYTYIYKDVYDIMARNRTLAATVVFLTSAIIHEYIIAFPFGFFYPICSYHEAGAVKNSLIRRSSCLCLR
ncbi:sterol O-acyltransferase 1 isoform X2 [Solenopsis invicta]|uniref:sterol O-acyltransferase 1 isoform X2 n=1 Tax=Solenopsis invicta TaxID=13686 RepID=UPI00193E0577|nr:sterol O-acyltransferase 1 isoform X2 [Solenopsis invicta]XP_039312309.1 sterol O-acyltransferase 1 isoform X2 [Solenopsis invicta]